MSQRNFQNARNQGGGPKGKSRKSASSAKIKSQAGSSVYVRSKDAKAKAKSSKDKEKRRSGQPLEAKSSDPNVQMRRREHAMASMTKDLPEYKKWRRIWWVLMILAFIAVIGTTIPNMLIQNGVIDESLKETMSWASSVAFIFAVVALIGAFYIDFRKIRKLQKAQEAKAHNLSKAERKELDAAISRAIEKDNQKRAERKNKMPWNRKKNEKSEESADKE